MYNEYLADLRRRKKELQKLMFDSSSCFDYPDDDTFELIAYELNDIELELWEKEQYEN